MQESHYSALTETSALATFIFDVANHQIVYKNSAFSTLLGMETDITQMSKLIHPEDIQYANECYSNLINDKLSEQVQFRIITPEHGTRWIRIMASLNTDDQQAKFIYAHVIDVTADIASQLTYEKYANKKNSILNVLAHELAGFLGIVRTLSTSLRSEALGPVHNTQLNHILELNQQSINLIKDLINREFLETTEIVLAKRRVDISKKLREYVEEAQRAEREIKRIINFHSLPETIFLNVDEPKFMQIINNLLSNALKFTEDNAVISISVEEKEESVLFSFADNGIGIPKEHFPILFNPYTKAGRTGLKGEPSMGLGMNVVKTIVEWHNGKIWFESEEGLGTTFFLEFPK